MSKFGWILNTVIGLAFVAGGCWLVYAEVSVPPISSPHLYLGVGLAIFGAILINPTTILGTAKQVIVVLLPALPWAKAQIAARESGSVTVTTTPPSGDKG